MDAIWKELPVFLSPKRFKNKVPIFQVIRSFELEQGLESLCVDRWFTANGVEGLRVSYERPIGYSEILNILNGKITDVLTVPEEPKKSPEESEYDYVVRIITRPSQKPPTYHNIKRFEKELKQLP